jgi:hypothetical protein
MPGKEVGKRYQRRIAKQTLENFGELDHIHYFDCGDGFISVCMCVYIKIDIMYIKTYGRVQLKYMQLSIKLLKNFIGSTTICP